MIRVGGLGDGWGELRAGLRQTRTVHAFFAASFGRKQWREHSRNSSSGAAGAGWGAAQRREPVGIGGHLGPGDAAFSDRGPVGRCRVSTGHRLPECWPNNTPDFRGVSDFRQGLSAGSWGACPGVLALVSRRDWEAGQLALDGTKVRANASRNKAMSYGRMKEK